MLRTLEIKVDCPNCHHLIHIPFLNKLKAKAIYEYDMTEISSQEELHEIKAWLHNVSWVGLIKFWFERRRNETIMPSRYP